MHAPIGVNSPGSKHLFTEKVKKLKFENEIKFALVFAI